MPESFLRRCRNLVSKAPDVYGSEGAASPEGGGDQSEGSTAGQGPQVAGLGASQAGDSVMLPAPPPPPPPPSVPPPLGGQAGVVAEAPVSPTTSPPGIADGSGEPVWDSRRPVTVGAAVGGFEPQQVDPQLQVGGFRPDLVADAWSTRWLTVRAASVRGMGHRQDGLPRQDDVAVTHAREGRRVLLAVADGVSAARHADVGAATAVRYAVGQWLPQKVGDDPSDANWNDLARSTAWALAQQASRLLGADEDPSAAGVLATTLVCAVIDADGQGGATAHVIGIGDSAVWIWQDGHFNPALGGKQPDADQISSSRTVALPQVPPTLEAKRVVLPAGSALVVATDGVGDPLGSGQGQLGAMLSQVLHAPPPLLQYLHALDFVRETFDDDRAMVTVWPRPTTG